MLEALTDFWKPVKKVTPPKIKLTDMQIGTVVGFGYVPQTALSGRKLTVTAINSYQFGKDVLTSFVLTSERDGDVSMIIAEAQGEQYLAISRKLSVNDRNKLFENGSISRVTSDEDVGTFICRDNVPELKGWLVGSYKREIQGMQGFIHHADFRNGNDGSHSGKEFEYCLLGSNSNEHAIEIESYQDGQIDVYATIYRRTSDISEVIHKEPSIPQLDSSVAKPVEVKLEEAKVSEPAPKVEPVKLEALKTEPVKADPINIEPAKPAPPLEIVKTESKKPEVVAPAQEEKKEEKKQEPSKLDAVKMELLSLPEMIITPLAPEIKKEPANLEPIKEVATAKTQETKPLQETTNEPVKETNTKNNNEEKKDMSTVLSNENKSNGAMGISGVELKPVPSFGSSNKDYTQEIKAVTKSATGMDNESIECDLKVANQIIEEAIRNEMRLSDVVRRIIELPVSHQEVVHLPINLADEDYSLLAIRYGILASDRNAIKLRIIQDLADFSGNKKKAN